jgi:hypothetical protein
MRPNRLDARSRAGQPRQDKDHAPRYFDHLGTRRRDSGCAAIPDGIGEGMLVKGATFGGMNDFHAQASRPDAKVINF